jgi:hypothetical protein
MPAINIHFLIKQRVELYFHDRLTISMIWIAVQSNTADFKMIATSSRRFLQPEEPILFHKLLSDLFSSAKETCCIFLIIPETTFHLRGENINMQ